MTRTNVLLAISLLSFSVAAAAQNDFHLADSPAKDFFQNSAWAHGYMHGYENGFHDGNIDLHMARKVKDPHKVKGYKKAGHEYHSSFGNRHEFEQGYCSGFEVGYLDGFSGKEFRASSEANQLATSLEPEPKLDRKRAAHFDIVLGAAYGQGRRAGLQDGRSKVNFREAEMPCPDLARSQHLCSAYQAGFRWGYSDGYSNQRPETDTQRASK